MGLYMINHSQENWKVRFINEYNPNKPLAYNKQSGLTGCNWIIKIW